LEQGTPTDEDSRTDDSSKISQRHLEQVHDMVADAMLDIPPAPNVKGLLESCVLLRITTGHLGILFDKAFCHYHHHHCHHRHRHCFNNSKNDNNNNNKIAFA